MKENDIDFKIAELQREKETLSQQVKRLIKSEGKLYQYQEELDARVKEYKELYELGKKLDTTFELKTIFEYTVAYVTRNLEYERAVLFQKRENTGGYRAYALEGYYDKQEKSRVAGLVIEQDDPLLSVLFAGREYLICKADTEEKELAEYRAKLRMNEYFIYRLGATSSPHAVLAVGNSAENAQFYRKVSESHGTLLSLGNFAGLISSSIEKYTYYKEMETARLSHLRFLESLERVDRAIRQADSFDQMLTDVLDTALSIFDSDRAWLLYPCDPEAPSWRVPMERTRPEYPGALAMGIDLPTTPEVRRSFLEGLNSRGPVVYDPQSGRSLPPEVSRQFSIRSQIMTAVYPKMGKPWLFGMHQCSYARVWSEKDQRLFTEIGRRMADGLSSLLFLKDLRESEGRFRALVENLPVKVFIKDRESAYLSCNPSYAQDLGINPEEIQGKTDYDFHPRELAEKYRADDKRIMDTGRGEEFEEEYMTDGRRHWVLTIKTPLRDAARDVTGILGVFWDITDRKQAEASVQESRERFKNLVEASSDWVWEVDEHAVYTYASPKVREILGYEPEEVLGKTPFDLMPPDEAERCSAIFNEIAASQKAFSLLENVNLHKNGNRVVLETSGVPFFDNTGNLKGYRGIDRDITERKRAEETIRYQTYHDLLTGLPNRALFADLLDHQIDEMRRLGKRLAVLFLDVDQFKNINDSFGHSAGDTLIRHIGTELKNSIREFDTIARIGGDEFTLLAPLMNLPEDASRIADKVMRTFSKPFIIDHHEIRLTASIGISLYPEDGRDAGSLLKNADIALHFAKDQGRDNYQFYNSSISRRTLERVIFENRLRQAVERGELVVHYQPQQNIKTGKITGAEALVRWNHPDLGTLSPAQFIPLAEETGLIIEIDQWVLGAVCRQLKTWETAGHALPFVTANLSARQFQQPALAGTIAEILEKTGLSPENLGIEITETLAMRDTELTSRNLSRLNAMGVKLLIDDFGTGYSSLSYLKKLPIHKLKIDKSFITDLAKDRDDQAITNAIVAMAHILKLKVVAEGVETEGQESLLESQDCDEMQGFLFSKPVTAEEFEKLLVTATGDGGFETRETGSI